MDEEGGSATTFTQEQVEAAVAEANQALEAKARQLLAETKAAKEQLRAYGDLTPDDVAAAQSRLAELEQQAKAEDAGITSEKLEALRLSIGAEYEKKFGPTKERLEALQQENLSLKLDSKVKAEMGKSGVLAERIDSLFRLEGHLFTLTDDGVPMIDATGSTDVGEFVQTHLAGKYPEWFQGSGSSGGGAPRSAASGSRQQVRSIAAGDRDAFMDNLEAIADGSVTIRND